VQLTVVVPFGNIEPEAGVQVAVHATEPSLPLPSLLPAPHEQLSVTVGDGNVTAA
jgi:hypothetical protein